MRTFTSNLAMCCVLSFAAACPSADELKEALKGEDAGVDQAAPAGRGGSAHAAGKGAAGSAAMPDEPAEDEDELAGAGGSAAPEDRGEAGSAAGRAGSPAASGGKNGSSIGGGRAPGPAAASGGSSGSPAGYAGSPAADSGGTAGKGSSTIDGSAKLASITTDSQAEALCAELRAKIEPRKVDAIERGLCTLEALTGELQGLGECSALVSECSNAAADGEPIVLDTCTVADVPHCANVSVDEFVACTLASIESSARFFGQLTCTTDLTTLSDLLTPAACVGPYQRCPELDSGSEDGDS
jgi:hypothetical protein